MKKHLSVFMLLVRTSIWKVLLILGAMAASQVLLFFALGAGEEAYLLDALERVPFFVVVFVGLLLLTGALCFPLSDRGGRMNNLILRLGLSEKRIFWLQVLFNALVYSLFIMTQALTMLLLCRIYDWVTPGTMDPMAIFVTSYQYPLFHFFFPLNNVLGWLTNFILVIGLSICTAACPVRQRHRFNSSCTAMMSVFAAVYYCGVINKGDHLGYSGFAYIFIITLILVSICLFGVMTLEVDDDGKT